MADVGGWRPWAAAPSVGRWCGCQRFPCFFLFGLLSSPRRPWQTPPSLRHQAANGESAIGGPLHGKRPCATRHPMRVSLLIPRVLPSLPVGLVRRWASDMHPPMPRRERLRQMARSASRPQLLVVSAGNWQLPGAAAAQGRVVPCVSRSPSVCGLHHVQHALPVLLNNAEAMPFATPSCHGPGRRKTTRPSSHVISSACSTSRSG